VAGVPGGKVRVKIGKLGHIRLYGSLLAGALLFLGLPAHWPVVSRILVAWNGFVLLYLALVFSWMPRLTAKQICQKYLDEDPAESVILIGGILAAVLSLVAIVAMLSGIKEFTGIQRTAHFVLSALTIITAWTLVPTMFTLHYADMFYSVPPEERPLAFPQGPQPLFWDFAYFAFTIAAACQTSDVATHGIAMRKVVLAQTIISFLFNAAILGFAINITAGLMAGG
jgi:uncharacterized membrane protein